jgi:drug/metabolite transporter (DMT)-like permease
MFTTQFKGYFLAIVSAIFYGLIPLFILPLKQLGYSTDTTLFYRFTLAAVFLLIYLIAFKKDLKIKGKELLLLIILGVLYAASTDTLLIGYDLTSPGIASTILYAFPIMVAVIMYCFFKEKLNKFTVASLILTFVGVVILSLKSAGQDFNFWGLAVCLLCALFYAIYLVIINVKKLSVSGLTLSFYSLFFSGLYFALKIMFTKGDFVIPSEEIATNLVLFALIPTVISIVALVYAIKFIGSTNTSILGAFEPIVAVLISVALFSEAITSNLIIGVILIISGVLICVVSSKNKIH